MVRGGTRGRCGAYVVVTGRDARVDEPVDVLDGAARLLLEQPRAGRDGEVERVREGGQVDLEAVVARGVARAGRGRACRKVSVTGDLGTGNMRSVVRMQRGVLSYVYGDALGRPGV